MSPTQLNKETNKRERVFPTLFSPASRSQCQIDSSTITTLDQLYYLQYTKLSNPVLQHRQLHHRKHGRKTLTYFLQLILDLCCTKEDRQVTFSTQFMTCNIQRPLYASGSHLVSNTTPYLSTENMQDITIHIYKSASITLPFCPIAINSTNIIS